MRLTLFRTAFFVGFGLALGYASILAVDPLTETLRHVRPSVVNNLVAGLLAISVISAISAIFLPMLKSAKMRVLVPLSSAAALIAGLALGGSWALSSGDYLQISHSDRSDIRAELSSSPVTVENIRFQETRRSVTGQSFSVTSFEIAGSFHRLEFGDKASGWLTRSSGTSFYLVQGDGVVLRGKLTDLHGDASLALVSVPTNLEHQLISETAEHGKAGIRGALSFEGYLLISATDNFYGPDGKLCWVTSVWIASESDTYLDFRRLYTPEYCPRGHELELLESGGALLGVEKSYTSPQLQFPTILFASGDYRDRAAAQDPEADVGAILEVSLSSGQSEIRAKGVRNPQGFAYLGSGEVLFTEQGPEGGDEVNGIDLERHGTVTNFGWPVASYGTHYGDKLQPLSPLLKSHDDYGFTEPLYYWVPSIGPAGAASNPFSNEKFAMVVASLGETPREGDMSLLFLEASDYSEERLSLTDYLFMGERIRDVIAFEDSLLALGDDGALRLVQKGP